MLRFVAICCERKVVMSIQQWAQKIAAAVMIEPGERAAVDAVLRDHLDEFEQLLRATKLKIPAFARALTVAGLTLESGRPYDSHTLRTQINRARLRCRQQKRDEPLERSPKGSVIAAPNLTVGAQPRSSVRESASGRSARSGVETIFQRLEQSKPKRSSSLLSDED